MLTSSAMRLSAAAAVFAVAPWAAPAQDEPSYDRAIESIASEVASSLFSLLRDVDEADYPSIYLASPVDEAFGVACQPLSDEIENDFFAELRRRLDAARYGGDFDLLQDLSAAGAVVIRVTYGAEEQGDSRLVIDARVGFEDDGALRARNRGRVSAPLEDLGLRARTCLEVHERFSASRCEAKRDLEVSTSPLGNFERSRIEASAPFEVVASYDRGRSVLLRQVRDAGLTETVGFIRLSRDQLADDPDVECSRAARSRVRELGFFEAEPACAGCPTVVALPGGAFTMGSPLFETGRDADESEPRSVTIDRPFAIGEAEVTVDEWAACVDARGCSALTYRPTDGRTPAEVSAEDAEAYLAWISQRTGLSYRLPTEAEWEYAARAGATTRYSWGDLMQRRAAVCRNCGFPAPPTGPEPASSARANEFGLMDLLGNVWEWTADAWRDPSTGVEDPRLRVVRGGSWRDDALSVRAANRSKAPVATRGDSIGFRIARTLE